MLNCTTQGDFDALGSLVSDAYLSLTFAGGADLPREDLLALAAVTVIPRQELIAFDNVSISGDRATAEVISSLGSQTPARAMVVRAERGRNGLDR